jgi:hypothetical protein
MLHEHAIGAGGGGAVRTPATPPMAGGSPGFLGS